MPRKMQEFLNRVGSKQKKYFTSLRSALLAFPEIEESVEIDEFRGDWCPTYRVKGKDLVWVHFNDHLSVSLPIEPGFAKKALQDENLDENVLDRIREAEDVGEAKMATVELKSDDEVDAVLPLLQLRHTYLKG